MTKYRCTVCGYIYDPAVGDDTQEIKPGTAFEDIPETWRCPVCGVPKSDFVKEDQTTVRGGRGKNAGFYGNAYSSLAPKYDFFRKWKDNKGKIPEKENTRFYIPEYYNRVLKILDPIKVYSDLDGKILLCYEKENEFCHRHLVAYWLEECMDIAVDEVKVYNQKLVKLNRPEYLRYMLLDEIK